MKLNSDREPADRCRSRLHAERQVIEAYDAVLRRLPDPSGLEHFSRLVLNGTLDRATLMADLYTSDEARARLSHETESQSPRDQMVVLSGLFAAAEEGCLAALYTDEYGAARIGYLAGSLLSNDLGAMLVAYYDAVGGLVNG